MTPSEISQHFSATIGQLTQPGTSGAGVLSHIRLNAHNGFPLIGIHLGLNTARFGHLDKSFVRKRIREYFLEALTAKESLRCLLEVRNEPRVDLYLCRTQGLLSSTLSNLPAKQLIEYWCRKDGLAIT